MKTYAPDRRRPLRPLLPPATGWVTSYTVNRFKGNNRIFNYFKGTNRERLLTTARIEIPKSPSWWQIQVLSQNNVSISVYQCLPFRPGDLISFWIMEAREPVSFVAKAPNFTALEILYSAILCETLRSVSTRKSYLLTKLSIYRISLEPSVKLPFEILPKIDRSHEAFRQRRGIRQLW